MFSKLRFVSYALHIALRALSYTTFPLFQHRFHDAVKLCIYRLNALSNNLWECIEILCLCGCNLHRCHTIRFMICSLNLPWWQWYVSLLVSVLWHVATHVICMFSQAVLLSFVTPPPPPIPQYISSFSPHSHFSPPLNGWNVALKVVLWRLLSRLL